MEYIRWAKSIVEKALSTRRVIIISGERQAGKTTLTKQALPKNSIYRTLDDTMLFSIAKDSPADFVKHTARTMIIDEIQKVPDLLPEIKRIVDENNRCGQFMLTGSADVMSLPEVNESLAGRVKNIRLRTLCEGEIKGIKPDFINKALKKKFPSQVQECSKDNILELALKGGYPEIVRLNPKERKEWHRDYLNTLLTRDLKNISNIRRIDALRNLMEVISAWSSKYMNISDICSSLQISKNTLVEYISLIEHLYLCQTVPAWTKTDYDKVGKKDKMYMCDTGLMANILNWHYDDVVLNSDRYGKLIETFAFKELITLVDLNSEYSLYHYRDREKREIDFIIETENNEILAIEIKGGSKVVKDDFKHIEWFKKNLLKDKKFIGIILYTGKETISFGNDLFVVPIASLWNN